MHIGYPRGLKHSADEDKEGHRGLASACRKDQRRQDVAKPNLFGEVSPMQMWPGQEGGTCSDTRRC